MRSTATSGAWFLKTVITGAGAGAFIGAVVASTFGAVIGAAVGCFNENFLVGDDYEALFDGFGEYSMQGMAFWCAYICAIYGGAAGAASGAVAWASRQWIIGLAAGVALPMVLWEETDLFRDGRNQAGLVWCAAMLAGSVAAGLLCASRKEMRRCPVERIAALDRPRE